MAFIPMNWVFQAFPKFTADKFRFHTIYCAGAFFTPWAYVYMFANPVDNDSNYVPKPLFTYQWYLNYKLKTGSISEHRYHDLLAQAGFH